MVMKLVLIVFLIASCSQGNNGTDTEDGIDAGEEDLEIVSDSIEAGDIPADTEDIEAPADNVGESPDIEDAPDQVDVDCYHPIRDCGDGCRQVTCLGTPVWSDIWDISGDIIAYYTASPHVPTGVGVYIKNLSTWEERRAQGYPDYSYGSRFLSMHGTRITYELAISGSDPYETYLYLLDLATSENTAIITAIGPSEERATFAGIDMFGDIIVWYGQEEGGDMGSTDLFMFDLSMMETTRLTYGKTCTPPRIWGRKVACEGFNIDYGDDVALYDLDVGEFIYLTKHPADQREPDIWQERIAWEDARNDGCIDIYWCDLPDCDPRPATTNWACQDIPTVEGDWIVWRDYRNDSNPLGYNEPGHDNLEIWGYNMSTGLEYQIQSFGEVVGTIKIENGKVYVQASPDPELPPGESSAIFEIDLSRFL